MRDLFKRPETAEEFLIEELDMEGFGRSRTFQTSNENDIEVIRQMIVNVLIDLQFSRFMEFQAGLPWWRLFERMVPNPKTGKTDAGRILNALVDLLDRGLVVEARDDTNEIYVLVPEEIYQEAMDYCGTWYGGYEPPPGTEVLMVTGHGRDVLSDPEQTAELLTAFTLEQECREINALLLKETGDSK